MPEIRVAGPSDAEALYAQIRQYYAYDHIHFDPETIHKGLPMLLGSPEIGRAWLVQDAGKDIGYAIATFSFDLEFGGRMAIVTDLYLDSAFRGKGLGSLLFDVISSSCAQAGAHSIELQVETDNTEAQAFYDKLGFKRLTRFLLSKRL
jgi:ribosomal protein S18 acetylase RimI-like enzyme